MAYYTPEKPTSRKAFHTSFTIEPETQEPLLQAILLLRRVLTIGEGLRMQDVKRYGMVIYRRTVSESAEVLDVTDLFSCELDTVEDFTNAREKIPHTLY